jgi:VWFA-related protein
VAPVAPTATAPAERIEVRLAQFDVVVRDKNGKIVSGLGPGDFEVLEDGLPMEIVAVDEWGIAARQQTRATTPPQAPSPPPVPDVVGTTSASDRAEREHRSFILVFDALGPSTALRMSQAKRAAADFVRASVGPDDLAAVYQLDMTLRAVSGVTSNIDQLVRGIDKVTWMSPSSLQDDIAESVLSSVSRGSAPLMQERLEKLSVSAAEQLDWQREHTYVALKDLASVFRELPGRRVLVLASPGFPMLTPGDAKTGAGGFTLKFRDLIRTLAAYGVTVYSLDLGNDLAAGDAAEQIDWRVAVGKIGLDENILSDLGLERSLGTASASARREFLGVIAAESGGRLLTQTNLTKAFEAIQEESTRFYRISCRVTVTSASDRYRKLVIKVKKPDCVVTSRRGRYSDITPHEAASSTALASVESLDRYRRVTTRGTALALPGSDSKKVPVDVVVEALGPIDLPTDSQGGAALDLEFRLVARAEGEIVDRYERSFTARVKPDGVPEVRKAFRLEGRLSLVPGIYEIHGTVRLGEPPQLASWSSIVAVPPPPKGTVPAFVSVLVVPENEPASPLLSRPSIPDDLDPLFLKPGARILPATSSDFATGSSLLALFWMRGIPDADEQPPALDISVDIADNAGHVVELPTQLLFFGKEPSGGYRALARINAGSLAAGAYTLRLAAGVAGHEAPPARQSVPFTLHAKNAAATSVSAGSP